METGRHKLLDLRMPEAMDCFGCIKTSDERYVIMFGGCWSSLGNTIELEDIGNIYVLDMNEMTFRRSNVECPNAGVCDVILMGNEARQGITVNGYIRECWSLAEFDGVSFPSVDIINLIFKRFTEEMLYLLEKSDKLLWRISVDKILSQQMA